MPDKQLSVQGHCFRQPWSGLRSPSISCCSELGNRFRAISISSLDIMLKSESAPSSTALSINEHLIYSKLPQHPSLALYFIYSHYLNGNLLRKPSMLPTSLFARHHLHFLFFLLHGSNQEHMLSWLGVTSPPCRK